MNGLAEIAGHDRKEVLRMYVKAIREGDEPMVKRLRQSSPDLADKFDGIEDEQLQATARDNS